MQRHGGPGGQEGEGFRPHSSRAAAHVACLRACNLDASSEQRPCSPAKLSPPGLWRCCREALVAQQLAEHSMLDRATVYAPPLRHDMGTHHTCVPAAAGPRACAAAACRGAVGSGVAWRRALAAAAIAAARVL